MKKINRISTLDFFKGILRYSIPSIISALVAIIMLPLVTWVYPADQYGYISNFYSIGMVLMSALCLGLDNAYIRFFNEKLDKTNRSGTYCFCLCVGLVVTLLMFIIGWCSFHERLTIYLFDDKNLSSFIIFMIYIFCSIIFRFQNINYRFSGDVLKFSVQTICYTIGNRLLFVCAVLYSVNYIYSVSLMLIATVIIVIITLWDQRKMFYSPRMSPSARVEFIRYSLPLMPVSIIVFLNSSIAQIFLGGCSFREEVGVLAIATSIANAIAIIPSAFNVYWGPFVYKYYKTEQQRIMDTHDGIMLLMLVLVLLIFSSQDIVYSFIGKSYRSSQPYFMLIMLLPITRLIGETTIYGISIQKKSNLMLIITAIGLVSNVVLCWLLIPMYGALGAAISIAASSCFEMLLKTIIAQLFYKTIKCVIRSMSAAISAILLCVSNVFIFNVNTLKWCGVIFGILFIFLIYRKLVLGLVYKSIMIIKK